MHVADPQFNVEVNAWLPCALLLAVRLMTMGLAWSWLWPNDAPTGGRWRHGLLVTAQAALTGLLASLTLVIGLAAVKLYTETAEWMAVAAATLAGLWAGLWTGRLKLTERLKTLLPGAALLAIGFAAIMAFQRRGEWVLGGWDPGIYISQGVTMSRTGSLHPVPDSFFARLDDRDLSLFTRPRHSYLEAHPVVPLDRAQRTLQPFFFPGTPGLIALLYRCGGLRAATRVNDFAGLLAALVFAAAALRLTHHRSATVFALAALVAQPLWLYHTHFPTSEMLQFLLLSGMALAFPMRARSLGAAGLLGGLLCLAEINRFSFLPFGMLFVFLLACDDLRRTPQPRMDIERSLQFGGLGVGALFAYFSNPANMERLYDTVPALLGTSFLLAMAVVVLDSRALPETFLRRLPALCTGVLLPAGLTALAAVFGLAALDRLPAWGSLPWAARGAVNFMGAGWLVLAAAGGLWLTRAKDPRHIEFKMWCVFLLASEGISLLNPEITRVLPWAARRNMEFGVPLAALLAALGPAALWGAVPVRAGRRVLAVLLCLLPAAAHAREAWRAWSITEHDGLTGVLARVADRTAPGDLIVADHFRWGTPLRFLYGRTVINGELFLDTRFNARMAEALAVLRSMAAKGARVRFLVSTGQDLEVYPVNPGPARLDWSSPEWLDREIVHGPRARGVAAKERLRSFRLYTWEPAGFASEAPTKALVPFP